MSDYGFRVTNEDNEVQIDGIYQNYSLEVSGSISNLSFLSSVVSIANNTNPPIAMVRPTSGIDRGCGVFDISYSDPNYTGVRFFGGSSASDTCSFDYKIFTVQDKSSEDYGLRIYNDSEKLVFDSGYTPFKILETGAASLDTTYTHASYSNPYYMASPFQRRYVGQPPPRPVLIASLGLAKQSATSVKPIWILIGGTDPAGTFDQNTGTNVTLIVCE